MGHAIFSGLRQAGKHYDVGCSICKCGTLRSRTKPWERPTEGNKGERSNYLAFFCFAWPTRTLKCRNLGVLKRFVVVPGHGIGQVGIDVGVLGRPAIRVKFSLQVGQKGRKRFTLGIVAITFLF